MKKLILALIALTALAAAFCPLVESEDGKVYPLKAPEGSREFYRTSLIKELISKLRAQK